MVDNLRRELIQVIRRCDEIVLRQPEINKILNGKYKEVIEDYKREADLDDIAIQPAPVLKSQTMVEDSNEPESTDDQEIPRLSNYEPPIYEPPQST